MVSWYTHGSPRIWKSGSILCTVGCLSTWPNVPEPDQAPTQLFLSVFNSSCPQLKPYPEQVTRISVIHSDQNPLCPSEYLHQLHHPCSDQWYILVGYPTSGRVRLDRPIHSCVITLTSYRCAAVGVTMFRVVSNLLSPRLCSLLNVW
jgi:hypothetical protein